MTTHSARPAHQRAWVHLAASALLGLAAAGALMMADHAGMAVVGGWTTMATSYSIWTWLMVRRMDGHQTERHSQTADSARGFTDVVVIAASIASLVGVASLLVAGSDKDSTGYLYGALGLASVAASWFTVHLVFTLRYARLFYGDGNHGVDFPKTEQPDYQDFAYLSFCLGMTYQVSDQSVTDRTIRHAVMRHTLLSYALGVVVIGATINLVVQLASSGG